MLLSAESLRGIFPGDAGWDLYLEDAGSESNPGQSGLFLVVLSSPSKQMKLFTRSL